MSTAYPSSNDLAERLALSQDVIAGLSLPVSALNRVSHGVSMSLRSALVASLLGVCLPTAEAVAAPALDSPSLQAPDTLGLQQLVVQTDRLLRQHGVFGALSSRVKSTESMLSKMQRKGLRWDEVSDRLAFRVVVEDEAACYRTRALIEAAHEVVEGERDDYIARPKANGYQSLHTVIQTADGLVVEVQIRTREMHHEAEFGAASHAAYKRATVAA